MDHMAVDPSTPAYESSAVDPVGTYALVIGVSEYPYLKGGTDASQQTYGLGQLAASALTAYRFFEWIRTVYEYSSAPLAKCWLLLSPTQDELAVEPELARHCPATMDNCVAAVTAWYAALRALTAAQARECRTVFFFSGHGVQRNEGQLVLLPRDFLKPPLCNVNEAIDTRNLRLGFEEVPRGEDLFFVDACRVNPPEMAGIELNPRQILQTRFTSALNPDRVAPVLYAAASGAAAWQPDKAADGISCFGQALIEGLTLPLDPAWPNCGHPSTHLRLIDLFRFMKGRVSELLGRRGSVVRRPIDLAPLNDDLCITELLAPLPIAPAGPGSPGGPSLPTGPAAGPMSPDDWGEADRYDAAIKLHETVRSDIALAAQPRRPGGGRLGPALALESLETAGTEIHPQSALQGDLHEVFGSERVTHAWHGARSFRLERAAGFEAPFAVHRVRRARLPGADRQQLFEVDLRFEDEGAHWIQLRFPNTVKMPAFGLVFPANPAGPNPMFQVEMARDREDEYAVEVSLSVANKGQLGRAAMLWDKYQDLEMEWVLQEIDSLALEEVLQEKVDSPLAALVAAAVLVRAGHGRKRADWLRNLAEWFPELPDALVLCAEVARGEAIGQGSPPDWGRDLLRIEDRVLPCTSYGLHLAADQTHEMLAFVRSNPGWLAGDSETLLERLEERLRVALRQLHGRGLFAVFGGLEVSAELILPREVQLPAVAVAMA